MNEWYQPIKSVTGEFEPLKFSNITMLKIFSEYDIDDKHFLALELDVNYKEVYYIRIKFIGIMQFKLPQLEGRILGFAELAIKNIEDRQLESIRYVIEDHTTGFSFYCSDINVKNISKIQNDKATKIIWECETT